MKQGWEIKKLGEVCRYIKDQGHYADLPYIGMEDIESGSNIFTGNLNNKSVDSATFRFKSGFVLFGRLRPYLRKVLIPSFEGHCSTEIFPIQTTGALRAEFLKHWFMLDSTVSLVESTCTGSRMPRANMNDVLNFDIPIPSIPEQEQIVGVLDCAFAKIEALRANAQQNLQNTKDLFQTSIDKAYAMPTASKPIISVAKVINGYAFSSDDFKPINAIKSIKITNVGVSEFIEESDNYLPAKYADSLQDVQISSGDIVIALTRTIISAGLKVAIVPNSYNKALVNQRVAALVPFERVMSQKYLYNFLLTTKVKNYVLEHVNTLMQPNLSITDLKNMDVPYLPYEEQKVVANNIDALSERCRTMEENYRQTITHCDILKQALLTKAFNGEL